MEEFEKMGATHLETKLSHILGAAVSFAILLAKVSTFSAPNSHMGAIATTVVRS